MKNLIAKIILIATVILTLGTTATAATTAAAETTENKIEGIETILNDLLPRHGLTSEDLVRKYNEVGVLTELPDTKLEPFVADAIKTILKTTMLLTIIALVMAGIFYIISQGEDEDVKKAKEIILYLIIGMAIIAAAYGVVAGITQFEFFN